jgi:hypothetical protein
MTKICSAIFTSLLLITSFAQAASSVGHQNLQVVFDGLKPLEVISHDQSCGNGKDPKNTACRKAGPVRWSPVDKIKTITHKDDKSKHALNACKAMPAQGYYQCIVSGNVGDRISYNVISTDGQVLDPVIILN